MAEPDVQSYKNHGRVVPAYHIGVFFIFVANFIWAAYRLTGGVTGDAVVAFVLSIGLMLLFFSVRSQILTVQDRVIRLEMRLRFRALLAADTAARASALPIKQIVALRFASDAELPALINAVLSGQITDAKTIKQKVTDWQPDYLRA
jgi:hypothetical protein